MCLPTCIKEIKAYSDIPGFVLFLVKKHHEGLVEYINAKTSNYISRISECFSEFNTHPIVGYGMTARLWSRTVDESKKHPNCISKLSISKLRVSHSRKMARRGYAHYCGPHKNSGPTLTDESLNSSKFVLFARQKLKGLRCRMTNRT